MKDLGKIALTALLVGAMSAPAFAAGGGGGGSGGSSGGGSSASAGGSSGSGASGSGSASIGGNAGAGGTGTTGSSASANGSAAGTGRFGANTGSSSHFGANTDRSSNFGANTDRASDLGTNRVMNGNNAAGANVDVGTAARTGINARVTPNAIDTNRIGTNPITNSAGTSQTNIRGSNQAFLSGDTDKSGGLSLNEYKNYVGNTAGNADLQSQFNNLDTNHDNIVSQTELNAAYIGPEQNRTSSVAR